jgi:type IV secretion system protein VirB1
MISIAVLLTLSLQCAPTIYPDTSLDVAKIESGLNPFAIGVVGQKGIFPRNLTDALAHIDKLKANGKNFSVGLMQINQINFSHYGVTAKQLFDPCINLSVFEKIMTDCYRRGGTLKRALSCYYSGNFDTGQKPESEFSKTSYLQRMGYKQVHYIVPSTQADKAKQTASRVEPIPSIRYPKGIIRGEFIVTSSH